MDKQPNIVLINCDDLGYGDLGCYGSISNKTPHIDRISSEGVQFSNFYMASAVCSPSRGAMMTGCYPPRVGFGCFGINEIVLHPGMGEGLNPQEATIASVLKQSGYDTKMIGKWHCGDQPEFLPTNFGFDDYYGLPYSNDMGRQVDHPESPPLPLIHNTEVVEEQPDQAGLTERYTEEAVRYIRSHQEKPFFLYLAHMHVHVPIYLQDIFRRNSQNGAYGGAVETVDWSTGVIMHELKKCGIDDNTIVVFTSDNGSRARDEGGSNLPLRGTKATTWEGGIRVPCIVRWPEKVKSGRKSDALITSMDFLPTFASLAGRPFSSPRPIDGIDMSSVLLDETAPSPRDTFFYYWKNDLDAVRVGKWKLFIRRRGEEVLELYNLESDIGETTNVAEEHPEVVRQLRARARECIASLGDNATGVVGSDVRPIGRVKNAKPLTEYDPNHPYIVALYDLADSSTITG